MSEGASRTFGFTTSGRPSISAKKLSRTGDFLCSRADISVWVSAFCKINSCQLTQSGHITSLRRFFALSAAIALRMRL